MYRRRRWQRQFSRNRKFVDLEVCLCVVARVIGLVAWPAWERKREMIVEGEEHNAIYRLIMKKAPKQITIIQLLMGWLLTHEGLDQLLTMTNCPHFYNRQVGLCLMIISINKSIKFILRAPSFKIPRIEFSTVQWVRGAVYRKPMMNHARCQTSVSWVGYGRTREVVFVLHRENERRFHKVSAETENHGGNICFRCLYRHCNSWQQIIINLELVKCKYCNRKSIYTTRWH